MASLRMVSLWPDPRTRILILRKRIPTRLRAVSGRKGEHVKLSTGTADRKLAEKTLPDVLRRWAEMQAEWERKLNVVSVTPERAREIAAHWAAWIAADFGRLDCAGEDLSLFADGFEGKLVESLEVHAGRNDDREIRQGRALGRHADEASRLCAATISGDTRALLMDAMRPVVRAAYRQAGLRTLGITAGEGKRWNPLDVARGALPKAPDVSAVKPATDPALSFATLMERWKAVASVKPRTVAETAYALEMLKALIDHDDATRVTRADILRWRDATKADGKTNNTWNNRHSMVQQVFLQAVRDGALKANPVDNSLRLPKSRTQGRQPYSDADAAQLLNAARQETSPSLRWAHWVMAFTGMRAGEVLQMTGSDVRREGDVWYLAVSEDATEGKSVKTGQPRHVPVHPALIREGFVQYAKGIAPGAPLFPDKLPDRHGQRGGRAWNVIGKWARQRAGVTDPRKAPNHSWRHRMEDELRAAEVPEDVRDAILGHARKTTGRLYGVRGEALTRLARYLERVPMPAGVTPNAA
jgi:integrase